MATYAPHSGGTPGTHYTHLITEVAVGDQIDITEILGRSARGIKLLMTAAGDVVEYKLNNLLKLQKHKKFGFDETVLVWSSAPRFSTFSETGALEHTTEDGIRIASIEIVSLMLSVGTEIEIVVW